MKCHPWLRKGTWLAATPISEIVPSVDLFGDFPRFVALFLNVGDYKALFRSHKDGRLKQFDRLTESPDGA
jgi:hypothetical protein